MSQRTISSPHSTRAEPPKPAHEEDARFLRDLDQLTVDQYARFRAAVSRFARALDRGGALAAGFGVRSLAGHSGIDEFHWAPAGRATFTFGDERRPGKWHVIWRRAGGHEIYDIP